MVEGGWLSRARAASLIICDSVSPRSFSSSTGGKGGRGSGGVAVELEYQFQGVSQEDCPSEDMTEAGLVVLPESESWRERGKGLRGD